MELCYVLYDFFFEYRGTNECDTDLQSLSLHDALPISRSLGAIGIVLLARQIGDGARFVVFALAAWASLPTAAALGGALGGAAAVTLGWTLGAAGRSEEHTSELQSLMRISYAAFCLKKKNHTPSTYMPTHAPLPI